MDSDSPMTDYQQWESAKLNDIDCDTDAILEHLKGRNTDMSEGFDSGMLAGLLGNRGVDPGIVAMLNDRSRDGNWGSDGGLLVLLFLIILMGGNGFGFRNGESGVAGVDRTVVNEANYTRLLDAVTSQGTRQEMAVQSLATNLNCTTSQIQSALASVDKQLAVNQGSIVNAIQSCCCNVSRAVETQGAETRQEIQQTRFQIQTTDAATRQFIQEQFCAQNAYLAQQFCDIKNREDQREIQALRDKNQELKQDADTRAILTAIANQNSVSGTVDTSAGTWTGKIS